MVKSSLKLTGIGLRQPHISELLDKRPDIAWVEVHTENYFGDGGKPLHQLEQVRHHYPVSLHGVGLSLGSTDELNWQHLKQVRDLSIRLDVCLISEHLSWSSINGHYLHDLLPLPYTEESLAYLVTRINQVQEYLHRQILIENISSYLHFEHSTFSEWDFLKSVAETSGCGILLDINNIYVSATNLGFNPLTYLNAIPSKLVQEFHLAGFSTLDIEGKTVLIDSHNKPIVPAVWELYRHAVKLFGAKPTIIEWDKDFPTLETLCLEAYRAEQIMREFYAADKLTG